MAQLPSTNAIPFSHIFSPFTSISRNIWHVYHACGLRHLLWVIVCNWVLRHLLCQIPEQFFVASRKKIAILHFAPNTLLVFNPEAQVDGATPFPPRSMSTVDGAIQENVPCTMHPEYIFYLESLWLIVYHFAVAYPPNTLKICNASCQEVNFLTIQLTTTSAWGVQDSKSHLRPIRVSISTLIYDIQEAFSLKVDKSSKLSDTTPKNEHLEPKNITPFETENHLNGIKPPNL